jgi:glycosyltransferase involved in cell wall biosynthesis
MIARYDPQKDHESLFQAISQFGMDRPFTCLLVGSGMTDSNEKLAEQIRRASIGSRIRLLGERTDIPSLMNAIDLHVLSSAYGESFPNVVGEALASGTPCVATDVGDAASIVGSTGWIVPPRTPHQLGFAIDAAYNAYMDRNSWSSRRDAGRHRILAHYSLDRMVDRYEELWRSTLDRE